MASNTVPLPIAPVGNVPSLPAGVATGTTGSVPRVGATPAPAGLAPKGTAAQTDGKGQPKKPKVKKPPAVKNTAATATGTASKAKPKTPKAPKKASETTKEKSPAKNTTTTTGGDDKTATNKRKKPATSGTPKSTTLSTFPTISAKETSSKDKEATDRAMELAKYAVEDIICQRKESVDKKEDPLWYRIEDVIESSTRNEIDTNALYDCATLLPEQVRIVENALKSNGLTRSDVTPQAMACLLEQARRFAYDLMEEAQNYITSDDGEITKQDLMLAYELREDNRGLVGTQSLPSISNQLPKLSLISQRINRIPLPPIPNHCYSGILLPMEYDDQIEFEGGNGKPVTVERSQLLTSRTYDIITAGQVAQRMVEAFPPSPAKIFNMNNISKESNAKNDAKASNKKQKRTPKAKGSDAPGYEASRGRQIPIKLKGKDGSSTTTTSKQSTTSSTPTKGTQAMNTSTPDHSK